MPRGFKITDTCGRRGIFQLAQNILLEIMNKLKVELNTWANYALNDNWLTDFSVKACFSNFLSLLTINFSVIILTLRNSPNLEALLGGQLGVEGGPVGDEDGSVCAVKNVSTVRRCGPRWYNWGLLAGPAKHHILDPVSLKIFAWKIWVHEGTLSSQLPTQTQNA